MWSKIVVIGFTHSNCAEVREKAVEAMLERLGPEFYANGYLRTPYAMTVQPFGAEVDQAFMLTVGIPSFQQAPMPNGWDGK